MTDKKNLAMRSATALPPATLYARTSRPDGGAGLTC